MNDLADRVVEVLEQHMIECTGLGEVTCRGCRDRRWMPWGDYHRHVADAILAAGVLRDEAIVKVEAVAEVMETVESLCRHGYMTADTLDSIQRTADRVGGRND